MTRFTRLSCVCYDEGAGGGGGGEGTGRGRAGVGATVLNALSLSRFGRIKNIRGFIFIYKCRAGAELPDIALYLT